MSEPVQYTDSIYNWYFLPTDGWTWNVCFVMRLSLNSDTVRKRSHIEHVRVRITVRAKDVCGGCWVSVESDIWILQSFMANVLSWERNARGVTQIKNYDVPQTAGWNVSVDCSSFVLSSTVTSIVGESHLDICVVGGDELRPLSDGSHGPIFDALHIWPNFVSIAGTIIDGFGSESAVQYMDDHKQDEYRHLFKQGNCKLRSPAVPVYKTMDAVHTILDLDRPYLPIL